LLEPTATEAPSQLAYFLAELVWCIFLSTVRYISAGALTHSGKISAKVSRCECSV